VKFIVDSLSRIVAKRPFAVFAAVVAVTMVLGYFSSEAVITDGNDGFAPDAPELLADQEIRELFGDGSSLSTLQVVVSSEGGDIVTADGLAAVAAVQEIIENSELAPLLTAQGDQPEIVSFLLPVEQAVFNGQPAPTSDAELKGLYLGSFDELPPEVSGVAEQLLSGDRDLAAPSASRGLMLVFLDAPGFDEAIEDPDERTLTNDFETFTTAESALAEEIRTADLPPGITAEPFSIELIFSTGDEFQQEVGKLFGFAALIIVFILGFVYWVAGARNWRIGARRAGADMLLTMVAIFMAIGWMNGIGVLMGPKYLGWIGDFGPMTQIIPILLIGLGVDYAIHLTTRYREEIGHGAEVVPGMTRAIHTVGVALILATATTAVGFLTNLVSPIPALKDFGILAAIGIGASFVIMLTFVASFRLLLDRRAEAKGVLPSESLGQTKDRLLPRLIGRTSVLAEKFAWQTVTVSVLLGVVGFFGVLQLKAEFSVTDFVPRPNPLLPTFDILLDEFGGGFGETTQVLVTGDVDTPEAHNAIVDVLDNLRTTDNVLQFGENPAAESVVSLLGTFADPESPQFDQTAGAAAFAAGVGDDGSVAGDADVVALYDVLAGYTNGSPILHPDGSGGYDAMVISITTQAGEDGAAQLQAEMVEVLAPLTDLGLSAVATSDEIINNVVITSLSDSQLSSLLITVLAAAALLMINFLVESRRPFLGLITIFPVALVMLWAFGLMPVFGLAFGPVTATVSALAVGIGVPYMIHITHRYQEDRIRFDTPEEAVKSTTTNTGGALAGSAFTTVAGFGILMTASLVPFQQLGLVTAYTILLALFGAVIVLPSMLILWDRWHRARGDVPVDPEHVFES
jgi:predicted RND superfamily exporter protein